MFKDLLLEISSIDIGVIDGSYGFRSVLVLHICHICTHTGSLHVHMCVCIIICITCVCVVDEGERVVLLRHSVLFTCAPLYTVWLLITTL